MINIKRSVSIKKFRAHTLALVLLLHSATGCAPERQNLLLDFRRCSIDGISFDAALRWKPADIDLGSKRYRRFEQLVEKSTPFDVYYGVCSIDRSHGQAMLVRLPASPPAAGTKQLRVSPTLSRTTTADALENLFGRSREVHGSRFYRPVLHTDGSTGRAGEWDNICPGFRVKFTLDASDRLSSILISPLNEN